MGTLKEKFQDPPKEQGSVPLWFWNQDVAHLSRLSQEEFEKMKEQTREIMKRSFQNSGYAGFGILPSGNRLRGFVGQYVFEEERFFQLYEIALQTAKEYHMQMAFYDEYGWPSGAAGGLVKRDYPQYTTRRLDKYEAEGRAGDKVRLPQIQKDYMGAVLMNRRTKEIADISKEIEKLYHTVSGQPLYYQIPKDKDGIWILMVFDCVIQGNQGLDYLNPDATDAYIGYTYETMYKRFPQYFGTVITKSFYDEPTLGYFREAGTYGHRTWTPGFNRMYEERYKESPVKYYPALFEDIGPSTTEARHRLYQARTEMFAVNFIKRIDQWCRDHGIQYMGHLYGEETVNPVSVTGDLMKAFQYQAIPGFDHIHDPEASAAIHRVSRIVSSCAYNWDKPLVMSESMGADEGLTIEAMYMYTMDDYASGVNYIVPHALWFDNRKENVFYPTELSYRNPRLSGGLKDYNTYVSRLNSMLQGGRHVADIGVLYPIDYLESVFVMDMQNNSEEQMEQANREGRLRCSPADADYQDLLGWFSYELRKDVTFLHPEVLDERCAVDQKSKVMGLKNKNNYEQYTTLIIPAMKVIRLSNLRKIMEFYKAGGLVVATGQLPWKGICQGEDGEVKELIRELFGVDPETGKALDAERRQGFTLKKNQLGGRACYSQIPDVRILREILNQSGLVYDVEFPQDIPGCSKGHLHYIHKKRTEGNLYFIANTTERKFESLPVTVRGSIVPYLWNPYTGYIEKADYKAGEKNGVKTTTVFLTIGEKKSLFITDFPS